MNINKILNRNTPSLDPHSFEEISIVSHAHADHVAFNPFSKPRIIICSIETSKIISYRYKEENLFFITLEYLKEYDLFELLKNKITQLKNFEFKYNFDKDIKISLYPAGHVLGSSQILIRTVDQSLLYTGDFKLRKNISCKSLEFPQENNIDYLIMESTFGKPKYVFPNTNDIKKQIIDFSYDALKIGYFPIILAYSLGKSQEVIKLLENSGLNIIVHGSIFNISQIYNEFGINLKDFKHYKKELINSDAINKKYVLIVPPHFYKNKMITNIPNRKVAVVTGWAIDNFATYSHKADASFPLSDHADYNELLEYAKKINAKKTLITHGFALNLARDLNKLGLNAEPLETFNPNSLFLLL